MRERGWWRPSERPTEPGSRLGERVGVEAEAFRDCFGVTAGGPVGGHVYGETLGLAALLQLLFGCANCRGHGGLYPADLVHAALCLQVPG